MASRTAPLDSAGNAPLDPAGTAPRQAPLNEPQTAPPNAPLKSAVIGLGVGARHAAGYHQDPRVELVALCDLDAQRLREIGADYPSARLTSDAAEILGDPTIDIVSIASYDSDHAEQVLLALAAGKHVYVEKPICLFDEEFERLDEALVRHPELHLSSNFVLRRAPAFRAVKDRMETIGPVYHLEGDYNYGRLHKLTDGWRGRIPFYSVSHGGAIHLIDLAHWLTGLRATEVVATGTRLATEGSQYRYPDTISAMVRFEGGATGKIGSNYASVTPHHHQVQLYGTAGAIIHTESDSLLYTARDPEKKRPQRIEPAPAHESGKIGVLHSFVGQIVDGTPADVSAADVMDAMAVSLAIERSLASGSWETVRYGRITKGYSAQHPPDRT